MKTSKFARLLTGLVVLCLAAFLLSDRILYGLGALLVNDQPPAKADMIVVIGGDLKGNRILKAGELVRQGFAPSVFVSGVGGLYGAFESDLAINFAVSKGYPREIFVASHYPALSTVDEARADLRDLRSRGVHSYLLVTSDFHTGRAGRVFRREGRDLQVRTIAAAEPYWGGGEWWRNREGRKIWFNEFTKNIADFFGI